MAKILVVEDSDHKLRKLRSFLEEETVSEVVEARSFGSGLDVAMDDSFDVIILDMTMTSFDKTNTDSGGRLRPFAGKEIVRALVRRRIPFRFVILTQYTRFGERNSVSLKDIKSDLTKIAPDNFMGLVYYDSSKTEWKSELKKLLNEL